MNDVFASSCMAVQLDADSHELFRAEQSGLSCHKFSLRHHNDLLVLGHNLTSREVNYQNEWFIDRRRWHHIDCLLNMIEQVLISIICHSTKHLQ
jgi:hypothetical protein